MGKFNEKKSKVKNSQWKNKGKLFDAKKKNKGEKNGFLRDGKKQWKISVSMEH